MSEGRTIVQRIAVEERRLNKIFKDIDEKRKATTRGLIQRAAFMRVSLEDLESDLNENGFTEEFSQGDQEPYQRERPATKVYNTMNASYQKIIRQLTDLLPKVDQSATPKQTAEAGDEFDQF